MAPIYGQPNTAYEWKYMPETEPLPDREDARDPEKKKRNREKRHTRKERREAQQVSQQTARRAAIQKSLSASRKVRMIAIVLVLGTLLLIFVTFTAYSTSYQSQINRTNMKVRSVNEDIDNLHLKLEMELNSRILIEKAEAMGMVKAEGDQIVYIGDPTQYTELPENGDLAQFIKENAYASW
ncbi:MAG: hypothetical protein LBN36_07800 [Clostridiales Family XIII bacterium]|jgi:cell division protein FtsL|nr:hypothetical protein [Clostridiales Family XIII bacterium]